MIGKAQIRSLIAIVALVFAASLAALAQAAPKGDLGQTSADQKPAILDQVGIDQRLNQQVPLDLSFVDENGQAVKLGQYFGQKPVVLSLVYYQCPMLCSQVLNGLTSSLNVLRFDIGREFDVVTVSFDPRDTPAAANETKQRMLKRYRRPGSEQGWHFLTGKKEQIDALTQAVGFRYAWDPEIQQYAHASGIMLLTADGHVAQYYYGIEYSPRDLRLGIVQTSQGKVGSLVEQVLLYCYHYDPAKGKYGAVIFNILRVSALAMILVLGGFMFLMFRRDAAARRHGLYQTS
ncbi:MAG TPA: SCO family protein [Candidatus Solibacter sp.]|jgi:protein SCO1/2|nr:SCO family protein [Candidatus Solibacter sp.]